ncbi:MAG TPA: peptidase S41, partial [Acidobacteriota bacterium]|nr:peptidase S41 [Acidobacteriota bacterium]
MVPALAQIDARMLRHPDVSATQIAFVYAGDIWLVPKEGGVAHRLSSPPGEESFPRFSPDGKTLAFSGNYDGNQDVYVVPATGGAPERVTHHPMQDRFLDWFPDGEHLLFASPMYSGRKRYSKLFKTAVRGGLPEELPLAYGEFGAVSPDGRTLAFMTKSRQFRTWKRYRGGWASDIHLYDFASQTLRNLTDNPANDTSPMWHGRKLYFLSDRSPNQRYNIWVHDLDEESVRQVTHFEEFDIHFPSIGPSEIVFEAGGRLYLLDLATEEIREVRVEVVTDLSTLKPRMENVSRLVSHAAISPTGKRVLFEARGDVFSVPAEHGPILPLTRTSGVAERFPEWSPDGKHAAYWSDESGEYELHLRPTDGSGEPRQVTSLGAGFRYRPFWSPDSGKVAFIDEAMKIRLLDIESEEVFEIDQAHRMAHSALTNFEVEWSADSRWMAYSRPESSQNNAIYLYDSRERQRHQVTAGYHGDFLPVFDPEGRYLFLLTNRHHSPAYSDVDNSWIYANATQIAAVTLRNDVPSLLEPRNDDEKKEDEKADKEEEEKDEESKEVDQESESEAGEPEEEKEKDVAADREPPKPVEIDLEGFEGRMEILPMTPGNYGRLEAAPGKLIFHRQPRTGSVPDSKSALLFYDFKEREEKTILEDVDAYRLSFDGKKILVRKERRFAIVDAAPKQKMEKTLAVQDLESTVDPRAEWRQIFHDAWRFQRDYFYDPGMHGVDWAEMKGRYGRLLDDAVTRWDVNFVLG